jgi:hypothetical protein
MAREAIVQQTIGKESATFRRRRKSPAKRRSRCKSARRRPFRTAYGWAATENVFGRRKKDDRKAGTIIASGGEDSLLAEPPTTR